MKDCCLLRRGLTMTFNPPPSARDRLALESCWPHFGRPRIGPRARAPLPGVDQGGMTLGRAEGDLPCSWSWGLGQRYSCTCAVIMLSYGEYVPMPPPLHQDGYAVVAGDGPGEFDVLFEVGAGPIADALSVRPGTVAYINTGGARPPGADAVVQVENTVLLPPTASGGRRVRIVKVTSSSPFTATRPFLISL